ncbi:MAG: DUF5916 domain-containing protein [Gemmatimonadaceae bacterium]|nr:DUF5916 domain-containing protein [Gemmatimonadaceae bacterium]
MLLTALLTVALLSDSGAIYDGRANHLQVDIPRIDSTVTVDGVLDESAWSHAARLTGFSQYQPVDGRPAEEPTEVLVWYSADAIYFGIRAREIHGTVVRATRANRDDIASEDHIQILLDTENGRQLAFLFGVNALGVQQDGTRSAQFAGGAGGASATGGGFRNINPLEGTVDLNPDYVFESKGRLVPGGYEVEIRIPFKSLRYQDTQVQTWGLHILRRIQHSGYQDTWAPAIRANANFLAQSGILEGLHDMKRGLVLEATPTMTARVDGSPGAGSGRDYRGQSEVGADVKWGLRQNLTLNATLNPDFSQVEADVGQVLLNERFALFYPEKRPFFLDGLELFDTPNQLIYTRRIAAPTGGLKLAGKLASMNVAAMMVQDDRENSWSGSDHPLFGIARLRRDFGRNYTLGSVLTAREDGDDYSRLAGADFRFYHSKLYFVQLQAAQSWTDSLGTSSNGSLLQADWDRTGRAWGFHYTLRGVEPDFGAAAGFVNRTGVVEARVFNRLSFYGAKGALVQTYGTFIGLQRTWAYIARRPLIETSESITPSATLRGGWQLSGAVTRSSFAYTPANYSGYSILRPRSAATDTIGFTVPSIERDQLGGSFRVTTPTLRFVSATASITRGSTPIFREAAPGRSTRLDGAIDLRPTTALRSSIQFSRLVLDRSNDDSRFSTEAIPRIKMEYQMTPSIFFRLVGQYAARSRSSLEDRYGNSILVNGVRDTGGTSNELSMDWLFSYRPMPGTLVYLGYGSTMEEPREFRFQDLQRTRDGFFGKVSYLFRF